MHRKLAGVDDLYTARAAIWQPASADCGVLEHRMQPSGGRPSAGCRGHLCAICRLGSSTVCWPLPGSRLLPAVGGGSCAMLSAWQPRSSCISTTSPTAEPITSPARAAHTRICGFRQERPPPGVEGGAAPSWRGLLLGSLRGAWPIKVGVFLASGGLVKGNQ